MPARALLVRPTRPRDKVLDVLLPKLLGLLSSKGTPDMLNGVTARFAVG